MQLSLSSTSQCIPCLTSCRGSPSDKSKGGSAWPRPSQLTLCLTETSPSQPRSCIPLLILDAMALLCHRLYTTGAFFFALAYCGSNLLEVARLLRVCASWVVTFKNGTLTFFMFRRTQLRAALTGLAVAGMGLYKPQPQ